MKQLYFYVFDVIMLFYIACVVDLILIHYLLW